MIFVKRIVYIEDLVYEKILLGGGRKKSSLEKNCKRNDGWGRIELRWMKCNKYLLEMVLKVLLLFFLIIISL